jgi:predicted permease
MGTNTPDLLRGTLDMLTRVWNAVRGLLRKRELEQSLDEELQAAVDILAAESMQAGLPAAEARRQARLELGGVEQVKEEVRAARAGRWIEESGRSLRFAVRSLLRTPGFTAVAVLSFALGIGAGTSIFSVVDATLLGAMPVPDPDALRVLHWGGSQQRIPSWDGGDTSFSPPIFLRLREQAAAEAEVFGFVPLSNTVMRVRNEAVPAQGAMVSDNYFSGLGVRPLIGRVLAPGDDFAGAGTSVMISFACWQTHFGLDPTVLGRTLALDGNAFRIVGVLPRGFDGTQPGQPAAFYVPMSSTSQFLYVAINSNFHWYVRLMARLRPDADDTRLKAALDLAFAPAASEYMQAPRITLEAGRGGITDHRGSYRTPLLLMLGLVGLVMLVVCANITGLSLARGAALRHEFAVRGALGAGRWRLLGQPLVESLVLASVGGGLGVVLSVWGRTGLARLLAGRAQDLHFSYSLDSTVLGFTLACTVAMALLSGILPAWWASRVTPSSALASRGTAHAPRLRTGRALVVAQIAVSVSLVTGAALLARTVTNLAAIDAGFDIERLLLCHVNIRGAAGANADPARFYSTVQDSLAAIPGVRGASLIEFPLLGNVISTGGIDTISGRREAAGTSMETSRLTIGESFFSTMGVPIVLGRALRQDDGEGTSKVVVVNETFVRKNLNGENPLGLSFRMWNADWHIVGVCHDIRYGSVKTGTPPTAYFPFRQRFYSRYRLTHLRAPYFAVRTSLPPMAVAAAVRKAIAAIDSDVAVTDITTQEVVRNESISRERVLATLCGSLATVALLLSCIGLYGLMSYQVAQRTSEFGIRMALGATPRGIAGPILKEAMLLAGAGVLFGLPATVALARLVRGGLYGVTASDPVSFAVAVMILVAISTVAAWLPARRGARLDPIVALRRE